MRKVYWTKLAISDFRKNIEFLKLRWNEIVIFDFIEKYIRTSGSAPTGLYCYNFCLSTSPYTLQPSGAFNSNRFNQIEFEFTTIIPPLDPFAQVLTICDPDTGLIVGVNKPTWRIYDYNFDLYLFEERINVVNFIGGNVGLMYAT